MNELMSVKGYDLTEITKMLLKMRDNCVRKDNEAYDDPERETKHAVLNDVIDIVNNPSLLNDMQCGHWYKPNGMMPAAHHGRHRCSACQCLAPYERPGVEWLSDYCPNCGKPMNGGDVKHETDRR